MPDLDSYREDGGQARLGPDHFAAMKICLVGARGRGLLRLSTGGSERQIALLARHFARRGHEVTLLVMDLEGPDRLVDGVMLKGAWDPSKGIRRVRAVTYRCPTFVKRLLRERADLYYVRGAPMFSPAVFQVARCLESTGLLGLAHDGDLETKLDGDMKRLLGGFPGSLDFKAHLAWLVRQRRALRLADTVVAQTAVQAGRCAAMGLPHVLIPSIVESPAAELEACRPAYDVVWVGNVHSDSRRWKGVEVLAELAVRLGDVRFAVVGELTAGCITEEIARLGSCLNVDLLGAHTFDETQATIAKSRVVLNTSSAEGFSNVMLEGWALGKPAFTLAVNPSDLLGEHGLGLCAGGSVERLAVRLEQALADDAWLATTGQRCQAYVRDTHGADAVCSRYEQLAGGLLEKSRERRAQSR